MKYDIEMHRYAKKKYLTLTVIISFCFPTFFARGHQDQLQITCAKILTTFLPEIRVSGGEKIEEKKFLVQGVEYSTHLRLGWSSSKVYLVTDAIRNKFILKDYGNKGDAWHRAVVIREELATRFLRLHGFEVPAVIATDVEKGIIVKAYVFGATRSEISDLHGEGKISDRELEYLRRNLGNVKARIKSLEPQFKSWLSAEGKQIDWAFEFRWINKFDLSDNNFLVTPENSHWVLIDP